MNVVLGQNCVKSDRTVPATQTKCVCAREKKRTLKHLKTTHFRPPANNTRPIEIDRVGSLCCWDFGSNTLRMKPHLRC